MQYNFTRVWLIAQGGVGRVLREGGVANELCPRQKSWVVAETIQFRSALEKCCKGCFFRGSRRDWPWLLCFPLFVIAEPPSCAREGRQPQAQPLQPVPGITGLGFGFGSPARRAGGGR